jgi:hypothetical protein
MALLLEQPNTADVSVCLHKPVKGSTSGELIEIAQTQVSLMPGFQPTFRIFIEKDKREALIALLMAM